MEGVGGPGQSILTPTGSRGSTYACHHCRSCFTSQVYLDQHMYTHTGEKRFHCQKCDRRFAYKTAHERHKCGPKTHRPWILRKHQDMYTDSGEKWLQCLKCGKRSVHQSLFEQHICVPKMSRHKAYAIKFCAKGPESFECQVCGQTVKHKHDVIAHAQKHKHVHSLKLSRASQASAEEEDCDELANISVVDVSLQCPKCKRSFVNLNNLKHHQDNNCGAISYKFYECDNVHFKKESTKYHMNVSPTRDVRDYLCHMCGRRFFFKSQLSQHLLNHNDEKNVECHVCGDKFSSKVSLKNHIAIHNGVKKFECKECGKIFYTSSCLRSHSFTHNAKKDFECLECGKKFSWKQNLNTHLLVHSDKTCKCQECGKKFVDEGALSRHSVSHSGVRNFECQDCGRRFFTWSNLRNHSRTHSSSAKFSCEVCGKRFRRKGDMSQHARTLCKGGSQGAK